MRDTSIRWLAGVRCLERAPMHLTHRSRKNRHPSGEVRGRARTATGPASPVAPSATRIHRCRSLNEAAMMARVCVAAHPPGSVSRSKSKTHCRGLSLKTCCRIVSPQETFGPHFWGAASRPGACWGLWFLSPPSRRPRPRRRRRAPPAARARPRPRRHPLRHARSANSSLVSSLVPFGSRRRYVRADR